MYLLDTNIVSLFEPRRRAESAAFIAWLQRSDAMLFLSTLTVMEIEAGILKLRREDKHARANQLTLFRDGLIADFADRILPLTINVALAAAHLAEKALPNVVERVDLMIAATAHAHGLIIITRNMRHFHPTGVAVLDPTALSD
jgi:predicted nucleic acid-binding protein